MTIDEIKNEVLENMKDFITTEVKDMAIKWIFGYWKQERKGP